MWVLSGIPGLYLLYQQHHPSCDNQRCLQTLSNFPEYWGGGGGEAVQNQVWLRTSGPEKDRGQDGRFTTQAAQTSQLDGKKSPPLAHATTAAGPFLNFQESQLLTPGPCKNHPKWPGASLVPLLSWPDEGVSKIKQRWEKHFLRVEI